MHSVYALLLVALLVFLLGRFTHRSSSWPLWLQVPLQSGLIFLLLGPLIGPIGLGLVHTDSLGLLDPALNLAIAWVGLVFGLQLRLRDLKRIQRPVWVFSIFQYGLAAGCCSLLALLASWFLLPGLGMHSALALGIAAGTSSATLIAIVLQDLGYQNRVAGRSALLVGNLDNLAALVAFILVSVSGAAHHQLADAMPLPLALLTPIGISMLLAWIFHYFLRRAVKESQFALLLAGSMTFAGGASAVMGVSPLAMGLLIGFWLANQSREANHLYRFMVEHEKPVFMGLVLMAGVMWRWDVLPVLTFLPLLLLLLVARTVAKLAGWKWLHDLVPGEEGKGAIPHVSWLMLPMGGLPLAIALSEMQLRPGEGGELVLSLTAPLVLLSVLGVSLLSRRGSEPSTTDGEGEAS